MDVVEIIDWAFRRQRVEHCGDDLDERWLAAGGSITARVAETLAIGAIVDTSRKLGHPVHPDALVVLEAVEAVGGPMVRQYARAGGLGPHWFPDGPGRFVPVRKPAGDLVYIYAVTGDKSQRIGCAVELAGDEPNVVAFARGLYAEWWDGLAATAGWLRAHADRLADHVVVGPAVPRTPWSTHPPVDSKGKS